MDDTFSARDLYRLVLEHWPRLIASAILGGLLLWAYGQAAPRRFRASASVNVDQNAEAVVPIGDESGIASYLNRETLRLETLAFSDEVWEEVARALADEGFLHRPDDISHILNDVRLPHPMDGEWRFTAYAADPALAARAAQLWAEAFVRHADHAVRIAREEEALRSTISASAQAFAVRDAQCKAIEGITGTAAQSISDLEALRSETPADPRIAEELRWAAEEIGLPCAAFDGCISPRTVSDQRAFAAELTERLAGRLQACRTVRDLLDESLRAESARWEALVEEGLGASAVMEVALLREAAPPTEPVVQAGWFIVVGALAGSAAWGAWAYLMRRVQVG